MLQLLFSMYDNGQQCGGLLFFCSATIINFISFHFISLLRFISVSPPILNLTFCCILARRAAHQIKMQLKTDEREREIVERILQFIASSADPFGFTRKFIGKEKKRKPNVYTMLLATYGQVA